LAIGLGACKQPVVPKTIATAAPLPRLWPGPTTFAVQAHARRLGAQYFGRIAAAGFDAVRVPLVPWWAQSRHGGWMFNDADAIYSWLVRHALTPLFVLQNPRTPDDFPMIADFAQKAASRYPLALLELGNEPDNPEQWPAFYPPRAPAALTPSAYWSIEKPFAKAWREGNPRARISTAGTSGMDLGWQRALIAAIALDGAFADGTIGAVAVHPYDEPLPPRLTRHHGIVGDLVSLKAMLPAGVGVWVTEYGLTEPQPRDVEGWMSTMSALGVPLFSWYEIQDDVLDGKTQRYGLVRLDGSLRPAYETARSFLHARAERP
jgi:hypothetical protein